MSESNSSTSVTPELWMCAALAISHPAVRRAGSGHRITSESKPCYTVYQYGYDRGR